MTEKEAIRKLASALEELLECFTKEQAGYHDWVVDTQAWRVNGAVEDGFNVLQKTKGFVE